MMQITPTETLTITPIGQLPVRRLHRDGPEHDASGVGQNGAMLGLQQAVSWSAGMDVNWAPVERISLRGRVHARVHLPEAALSQPTGTGPHVRLPDFDWISDNTDTIDTFHARP